MSKEILIALAGNQNSGKTTLFNKLTGSNQHVGNFPGVTVEKKDGSIKKYKEAKVVDLPGIYSLSPYSNEEIVTRDFILDEKPDVILNIIDATNIERNLYLTLQLMELNRPMVIALNMMDEVINSGNTIDVEALSTMLKVPCISISASKNQGIEEVVETIKKVVKNKSEMVHLDFCKGEHHKAIHAISHIIEDHVLSTKYPLRFAATKLVEGEDFMFEALHLHEDDKHIIEHIVKSMEEALHTDKEAALADMRYCFIEEVVQKCVKKHNDNKEQVRSQKMDSLLTHKYLGIPIFLLIMFSIFYLTFNVFGAYLQGVLEGWIESFTQLSSSFLQYIEVQDWLHSLLIDGIYGGVGSVLSFLPIIVLLFFFLSLLEDSGYMARVAFVMDKLVRKMGLSGKSFVPMLIGFGCSVPAIMATRTLSSEKDRKMTIILTPFMSCSAKLPIYGMIIAAFFEQHAALVMIGIYCIGVLVAIVCGLCLKKTIFKGETMPFVLELPAYRMPDAKSVILHMWEKAKDFLRKAFTIIFIGSMLIWFLQSFNFQFQFVEDSSTSILASIGKGFAMLFAPVGFGDWRAATALVTGITAKESVVSTLSVLLQVSDAQALSLALHTMFTPLSAFTFLVFTVLYMPCIAAFAATKRELGSLKQAFYTAAFQTGVAYVVCLLIYQIGSLLW